MIAHSLHVMVITAGETPCVNAGMKVVHMTAGSSVELLHISNHTKVNQVCMLTQQSVISFVMDSTCFVYFQFAFNSEEHKLCPN